MATFLSLNECTLRDFERGIREPIKSTKAKIQNKLSH